ncbi:MAG: lysylphosphatidylglycerol synthase transmembrane domain-containing protein [Candidatus Geothermincolia bacterium]
MTTPAGPSLPGNRSLAGALFAAISLSVVALLAVLFITMDQETWSHLRRLNPAVILAALGLLIIRWSCQVVRARLFMGVEGVRLPLFPTTKAILAGNFAGAITPFQASEIPVAVYFLDRYGLPAARATAVVTVGSVMSVLLFVVAMPAVLAGAGSQVDVRPGFQTLLMVAGVVALLLLLLAVYSMRDPSRALALARRLAPRRLRERKWFEPAAERFFSAITSFSESLRRILKGGSWTILAAAILTVVMWTSTIFIPAIVLWGLGRPDLFWQATLAQSVVSYLLPFSPTPGQSGVAELTFAGIYAVLVPSELIGLLALVWRFFTFYVALAVSGTAFVIAGRDGVRRRNAPPP